MISNFKYISLSFKKASLDIRNLVALNEQQCRDLVSNIGEFTGASDVFVLSTCNRTEIYYASDEDLSSYLIKLIGLTRGIDNVVELSDKFDSCLDHYNAVEHLFRVSLGLESQVIGDLQISNQIKKSYQISADLDIAGPFLHRLLHSIFYANKRASQETAFRDGAASVSYATVELIESLNKLVQNPSILVLGVGEMGSDVLRNLKSADFNHVTIANRTLSKGEQLAKDLEYSLIDLATAKTDVSSFDAIISTIPKGEDYHIKKSDLEGKEFLTYKYFIDISVPQSLEPSLESIPGVVMYNIDQINNKTEEVIQKRLDSIPAMESIISETIAEFKNWEKEMEVSPTIQKIKASLDQIRQAEIDRNLKDLTTEELQKFEAISKAMMQKVIKLPVLQLKAACKRGEAETLIDVLNDLFDLEKENAKS